MFTNIHVYNNIYLYTYLSIYGKKLRILFHFNTIRLILPLSIFTSVTPFSDSEKPGSSYPISFYFLNPRIDINWFSEL